MSDIKTFPAKPYFDDFEEKKNFLKVLFRPGYSVQTRELNQLQSILQDQIGILADFSIPDGSSIIGGAVNLVSKLPFIKFGTGTTLSRELAEYQDATFVAANGVEGTIKFMVASESGNPVTAYVKYDKAAGSVTTPANSSNITITFEDTGTEVLTTATTSATGNGAGVVMAQGIFYTNKAFVRTDDQLLVLNKYNTVIDTDAISIGMIVRDSIIRPEQDSSLLDNASGTPNQSAPGAHRYKSEVVLVNRADIDDAELQSYKELMKLEFGKVAARPRLDSDVTVLEQILARRTFDQAGDYIVDDFILDVREHLKVGNNRGVYTAGDGGVESKLALQFDAGVAYVKGFEVRTAGDAITTINKARTTKTASNALVQTQYGNAFYIYDVTGNTPKLSGKINLYSVAGTTIVGTAHVRGCEFFEQRTIGTLKDVFRLDVVNVKFNTGSSWKDIVEVRHHASVGGTVFIAKVNSYKTDGTNSKLIYRLPKEIASTILPRLAFNYKEHTANATGNTITLTPALGNETLDDEVSSYMIQHSSGNGGLAGRPQSVSVVGSTATINISNLTGMTGATGVKIIAKTFTSAPAIRTKTRVTNHVNSGLTAAETVTLSKADAISLTSVVSSSGADVTSSYYLDSGAKDAYYDFASIKLKPGQSVPSGTLTVTFSYFEHGGSGDFFGPDSYSSIPYDSIPSYTTSTKEKIFLGSAVDYRQRVTSADVLESVGRHNFVTNDQLITDITFYLPRMDKIVLTRLGEFRAVTGIPSETPKLKAELPNSITLYDLYIPPFTFDPTEVVISKTRHKRFTMKDIAQMEYRVDNIEEVTLLNSLERDIQSADFKDRFKSGYIADNFSSQRGADTRDAMHRCAYDLIKKEVRPRSFNTNMDLNVLSSSGVTGHPDGKYTLSYTNRVLVSQLLASDLVRLQPYMLYDWRGSMMLIPSSDIWFDTRAFVNTSINGSFFSSAPVGEEFSNETALLGGAWNFVGGVWRNRTTGKQATPQQAADLQKSTDMSGMNGRSTSVSSPWTGRARLLTTTSTGVSSVAVTTSASAIPFIRSRAVSIIASGLRPGTRVYPYFDGVDVSAHCVPTGAALVVAGNGVVTLTFTIPPNMFRTGARTFILKDVPQWNMDSDSTSASAQYSAIGTLLTTTTDVALETTSTSRWYDPVAQSFFIEPKDGVFVSSVELFFGPAAVNPRYTASVQIRPMVNGYPSSTEVITEKTLPGSSIVGSLDATVGTVFTFPSPVFLEGDTEYCFVAISPDDKSEIWMSTLGKRSFRPGDWAGASGEIISKQPYLGSMFKSQNNTTWTAEQTQDVKFKINRCQFNTTGNIAFRNGMAASEIGGPSDIHRELLPSGPLYFTTGSNVMRIAAYGHGFIVGDIVTLSKSDAASGGPYHGAVHTNVFGVPLTISAVETGTISVVLPGTTGPSIVSTGSCGGANVYANWAVDYSYVQLMSDCDSPDGTDLSYTFQGRTKANYSAGVSGTTYELHDDAIVDLGATYVAKTTNDSGLKLNVGLSSSNPLLSPIVQESRLSVHVMKNIVNGTRFLNQDVTPIRNANPSPAAYVQNTVTLAQAANELRVIFNANIPSGTMVDVFYKIAQTDIDDSGDWQRLPVETSLVYSDNPDVFREQNFIKEFATEFSVFKVMVQMISSDPTNIPRLKDYRALALAR